MTPCKGQQDVHLWSLIFAILKECTVTYLLYLLTFAWSHIDGTSFAVNLTIQGYVTMSYSNNKYNLYHTRNLLT